MADERVRKWQKIEAGWEGETQGAKAKGNANRTDATAQRKETASSSSSGTKREEASCNKKLRKTEDWQGTERSMAADEHLCSSKANDARREEWAAAHQKRMDQAKQKAREYYAEFDTTDARWQEKVEGSATKKLRGSYHTEAAEGEAQSSEKWPKARPQKRETQGRNEWEKDAKSATTGSQQPQQCVRRTLEGILCNPYMAQAWIAHNNTGQYKIELDVWKAGERAIQQFLKDTEKGKNAAAVKKMIERSGEMRQKAKEYLEEPTTRERWKEIAAAIHPKPLLCKFYIQEKCSNNRCFAKHDQRALDEVRKRQRIQTQEMRGPCQLAKLGWKCTGEACIGNHNEQEAKDMALPGDKRCEKCHRVYMPWAIRQKEHWKNDKCWICAGDIVEVPSKGKRDRREWMAEPNYRKEPGGKGKEEGKHRDEQAERPAKEATESGGQNVTTSADTLQCAKGHDMEEQAAEEETRCGECTDAILKERARWTCEHRCLELCGKCARKRIAKADKEQTEIKRWAEETKVQLEREKDVSVRRRQQCIFDIKMARNDPIKCLRKCKNDARCRTPTCTSWHSYTNPKMLAVKVQVTCGCPLHFPMPGMEGFERQERKAIEKRECPTCTARLICPCYA